MSENMEIDCLVDEPLPGDLDATSYDVSIPEQLADRFVPCGDRSNDLPVK